MAQDACKTLMHPERDVQSLWSMKQTTTDKTQTTRPETNPPLIEAKLICSKKHVNRVCYCVSISDKHPKWLNTSFTHLVDS